jgi:lambda repressor-like predicted transcriptional regulator
VNDAKELNAASQGSAGSESFGDQSKGTPARGLRAAGIRGRRVSPDSSTQDRVCRVCSERPCLPNRRKCRPCSRAVHRCTISGCEYGRYSRETGYCRGHHRAWRETGDPLSRRKYVRSKGSCNWPGCDKSHRRNGFCGNHSAIHYRMLASTLAFPNTPRVPAAPLVEHFESLRDRGWSAADIANEVGLERRSVQRWLTREDTVMNRATAEDICDALGLHPAMLWKDWVVCGHGLTDCDRCGVREYAA